MTEPARPLPRMYRRARSVSPFDGRHEADSFLFRILTQTGYLATALETAVFLAIRHQRAVQDSAQLVTAATALQ